MDLIIHSHALPNCYEFDDSVFDTPGAFYDLGCLRWEWAEPFLGRKPVIGVDPHEQACLVGAELVRAAISPYGGKVTMRGVGLQALCGDSVTPYNNKCGYAPGRCENEQTGPYAVPAITWAELTAAHGPAALVKINIEGAEIPLLFTARQPMAPQLVIAFHEPGHEYSQPGWPQVEAIRACIRYLGQWYTMRRTELYHSEPDRWYHFMVKQ